MPESEDKIEYAPVMELVDMRDLGAVTTVKVFSAHNHDIIKTAGAWRRLIYAGMVELADAQDLGAVTTVKVF